MCFLLSIIQAVYLNLFDFYIRSFFMQRTSYDTAIKHLYRLGLSDGIPLELRKTIPRTNIHRWKHEPEGKYTGFELNNIAEKELETLKAFAKARRFKALFRASIRITKTLQQICSVKTIEQAFRDQKETILHLSHRIQHVISVEHFIKILGISRATFHNWKREVFSACDHSFLFLCNQRFPLQASRAEVLTIKKMLNDSQWSYWPISSIAAYCRRKGILFLSDASWYRYAKLLGIKREKPNSRRKKSKTGIRATSPNQYWHADVSVFKINEIKHYIYLVSDNYSRKILSWKVSKQLSASLRVQSIQEACNQVAQQHSKLNVNLVVDGGSENNNIVMDKFIENSQINIQKVIALKDIHFSNSLVEAHFSLIKYNYLYRMKINGISALHEAMEFLVNDFNSIRPHGSLNGSTPDEAYFNGKVMPKNAYESQLKLARQNRVKQNLANTCAKCL